MNNRVLILGANGRFGRAASQVFFQQGWTVSVLNRSRDRTEKTHVNLIGINSVYGDIFDAQSLTEAIGNHTVVVNALNPPYTDWSQDIPRFTSALITAALNCSATVMIPGNIYNYGKDMPKHLYESTPHVATTKKGKIRIQMEQEYLAAAQQGLQTIILRGGDFIEKEKTGNWFDSYIINRIDKNILTYPGPLNQCHAWAFLPDMAEAMVQLAEQRTQLNNFEEFGFEGFNITGQELIEAIEKKWGQPLTLTTMPWSTMTFAAWFSPMVKEVIEMRYLWQTPHSINGDKLKKALPNFKPISFKNAIDELF